MRLNKRNGETCYNYFYKIVKFRTKCYSFSIPVSPSCVQSIHTEYFRTVPVLLGFNWGGLNKFKTKRGKLSYCGLRYRVIDTKLKLNILTLKCINNKWYKERNIFRYNMCSNRLPLTSRQTFAWCIISIIVLYYHNNNNIFVY